MVQWSPISTESPKLFSPFSFPLMFLLYSCYTSCPLTPNSWIQVTPGDLRILNHHPSFEPHVYTRDFNAYTIEKIENHITPLDAHSLIRRTGDINTAHSPASLLTAATQSLLQPQNIQGACY